MADQELEREELMLELLQVPDNELVDAHSLEELEQVEMEQEFVQDWLDSTRN